MPIIHVSLAFASLPDADLDEFASNILIKLTGNTAYATPLVSLTALGSAQTAFHNAIAATTQGGTAATDAKNTARAALVVLLRQQAGYVETTANGNSTTLLSSGYLVRTPAGNGPVPLAKPGIISLLNGNSTQLIVNVAAPANYKAIEAQVRTGAGAWTTVVTSGKSRGIVLPGLVPGTMYDVQVRAVGGTTGYSDWSDPVGHMCL